MQARSLAFAYVAILLCAVSVAGSLAAQEQSDSLPEEVRAWLEADQLRRWATLLQVGEQRFKEGSCGRCHGETGADGRWGPDLTDDVWLHSEGDLAGIQETIFWGVRRRDMADDTRPFEMNPAGGMSLEWEEVQALAAYVWSLGNGTVLPRRQ